jgi:hypothetical protein
MRIAAAAYYISHSAPPAPLLIANGFTDHLSR